MDVLNENVKYQDCLWFISLENIVFVENLWLWSWNMTNVDNDLHQFMQKTEIFPAVYPRP